jgi:dTMP kinase
LNQGLGGNDRLNMNNTFGNLRGKFIVLDGGEGCGKSTQSALLRDVISKSGIDVVHVRDPGSTHIGEMVRAILLDPANSEISMRCEMLLYMAARAQMVHESIAPALAAGRCVISDRFISSTLAYQLGGDGLTADEIRQVGNVAAAGRWPDLTILLDMPLEKSLARRKPNPDRIERRPPEYHQRVRENYLAQAAHDPARVKVVKADGAVAEVHAEILRLVSAAWR